MSTLFFPHSLKEISIHEALGATSLSTSLSTQARFSQGLHQLWEGDWSQAQLGAQLFGAPVCRVLNREIQSRSQLALSGALSCLCAVVSQAQRSRVGATQEMASSHPGAAMVPTNSTA